MLKQNLQQIITALNDKSADRQAELQKAEINAQRAIDVAIIKTHEAHTSKAMDISHANTHKVIDTAIQLHDIANNGAGSGTPAQPQQNTMQ